MKGLVAATNALRILYGYPPAQLAELLRTNEAIRPQALVVAERIQTLIRLRTIIESEKPRGRK